MFRLHSSKAPSDRSTSTARVVFTRAAAVMPRQPVPAHRSKIRVWPGFSLQAVHGQLGQHLRVHPGDQDLRAHIEGQAAEGPLPNEIGDGLPCQPAGQEGLGLHGDLVGGVQGDVPVEFLRRFSGGGADQFPGLQLGGLNPPPR